MWIFKLLFISGAMALTLTTMALAAADTPDTQPLPDNTSPRTEAALTTAGTNCPTCTNVLPNGTAASFPAPAPGNGIEPTGPTKTSPANNQSGTQ